MLKKFNTLFEEVSTFLDKENKLKSDSSSENSAGNTADECCDGAVDCGSEPVTDVQPVKPGITTDNIKEIYVGTLPFKKIQRRKTFEY